MTLDPSAGYDNLANKEGRHREEVSPPVRGSATASSEELRKIIGNTVCFGLPMTRMELQFWDQSDVKSV